MAVHLLLIGQVDDPEFAGLGDFLGLLPDVELEHSLTLSAPPHADREAATTTAPELIVVIERHPDEHPPQEIRRLIEAHPLARILCGYGPWSEAAARTRAAWPSATWVPVSLLREHILAELAVIRGERPPLAVTADRTDAFEHRYGVDSRDPTPSALASMTIAVDAPDREYRAMLEDELTQHAAQLISSAENWDLLLFDAHPEVSRSRELQRLLNSRSNPTGRVMVLHELPTAAARVTWSREELQTPLKVYVVSKLAPLAELLRVL